MNTTLDPKVMPARIDQYIEDHLGVALSDAYRQAKTSADTAKKHGFTGSANARYAEFLGAFRDEPEAAADYAERYPACRFLPWRAFHHVRVSLKLHVDLPEFYAGAIPDNQLPWLDLFEMDPADECPAEEMTNLVGRDMRLHIAKVGKQSLSRDTALLMDQYRSIMSSTVWGGRGLRFEVSPEEQARQQKERDEKLMVVKAKLTAFELDFTRSLFVVAPAEAFTTTSDFIVRARDLEKEAIRATTPPNDPLVVRFVKRGCLVVAAWGDEAAALNDLTAKLHI